MNKIFLIGNLGQDPELKTPQDLTICNFSIAVKNYAQDQTDWFKIVCFGKTAENCGKFLEKGSKVAVEGRLQIRPWKDKNGEKKYSTEIVGSHIEFLSTKSEKIKEDKNKTIDPSDESLPF